MTEPTFSKRGAGLTVRELAALTGAQPRVGTNLERRISGIAALDRAGGLDLVWYDGRSTDALRGLAAGACFANADAAGDVPMPVALLCTPTPFEAFALAAHALFPDALRPSSLVDASGTAASASIHPSVRLESGAMVDPSAVIGPRAEIGARTVIGAGAVIGADVRIGRDCMLGAHASIRHALVGDRVTVQAGSRIGEANASQVGPRGRVAAPQVGRVILQDGAVIGANVCVERGGLDDTVVGEGTVIDNLVQIGQNALVGRHCVVGAQAGIGTAALIEDYAVLGAQVCVMAGAIIREGAQVSAGVRVDRGAQGQSVRGMQ